MAIQDSVTSWFIQNIVLPNAEDMRNPGYINYYKKGISFRPHTQNNFSEN